MVPAAPVACSLSAPDRRERAATVLAAFRAHVREITPRPDGYALALEPTDEAIGAATAMITTERACCPFLRFDLTVDAPAGNVGLVLSGPPGTRELLAAWLEARDPRRSSDASTAAPGPEH
jgi:hypothetical protein